MFRALWVGLVLAVSSMVSPAPAQAAVICSFSGSGSSGTDCFGQAWSVGAGGWGIPGIGEGVIPFAGNQTATDFHFHCLTGCGPIDNSTLQDTQFSLSPFGRTFWTETLNGAADTIDFVSGSVADNLTVGRSFFVNITVPINLRTFTFEASWTNDAATTVPEPSSIALIGLALAGLGVARRRRT